MCKTYLKFTCKIVTNGDESVISFSHLSNHQRTGRKGADRKQQACTLVRVV